MTKSVTKGESWLSNTDLQLAYSVHWLKVKPLSVIINQGITEEDKRTVRKWAHFKISTHVQNQITLEVAAYCWLV